MDTTMDTTSTLHSAHILCVSIMRYILTIISDVNLPTYTDIQQWKSVINQLSRFLRLVDCLLLSLLRKLCARATNLLRDHLVRQLLVR